MSPDQIVAWNLKRARLLRGWTQVEAAKRLAPHIGVHWSKATYSGAERSVSSNRIRQFSADELLAFSLTFDFPIPLFLVPPPEAESVGHGGSDEVVGREQYLDLLFELDEPARKRLHTEVLEFTAPNTLALRRWSAGMADLLEDRDSALEALTGVRDPKAPPKP